MKTSSKRILLALTILLIMAFAITACGGGGCGDGYIFSGYDDGGNTICLKEPVHRALDTASGNDYSAGYVITPEPKE